ncbi:MAG: LytR/AlgR family response regulator transcription factor [Chitinophagaceae bacterium]
MITAIIVEDELHSRNFLAKMVEEYCKQVKLIGTAANVADAVNLINNQQPNLVFLDIEMQTGTGFEVLQQVNNKNFQVIFTTAYDHYAIKAIKFSAIDYLLKPISIDELQTAVNKALNYANAKSDNTVLDMLLKNLQRPTNDDYSISLSTAEGVEFVHLSQIIRLEANGPYTTFFLKDNKKIMVSKNLKEYETLLNTYQFFRIHNSHIINLKEVKKMLKTDGGYAIMNDDSMIAISPKKKDEFLGLISQLLI